MENILINDDAKSILAHVGVEKAKLVYLDPPFLFNGDVLEYLKELEGVILLSRASLSQDGFLAINCQHNLRSEIQLLLELIFGKVNYVTEIIVRCKTVHHLKNSLIHNNEHILIFSKSTISKLNQLYEPLSSNERQQYKNPDDDINGPYREVSLVTTSSQKNLQFEFQGVKPKSGMSWRFTKERMKQLLEENKLVISCNTISLKMYLSDSLGKPISNIWDCLLSQKERQSRRHGQQPLSLLNRLIKATTDINDIVVDPYCGSGVSLISSIQEGRFWYGGDSSVEAIEFINKNLLDYGHSEKVKLLSKNEYARLGKFPPSVTTEIMALITGNASKKVKINHISNNDYERTIVIIISIEEYASFGDNKMPNVKYANRDASIFRKMLVENWGVKDEDIVEFKNETALKNNLEYEVSGLLHDLSDKDRFIFYYAGHGFHDGQSNCISTYDTHLQNLPGTTLPLSSLIIEPVMKTNCKSALFFIDACAQKINSDSSRSVLSNLSYEEFKVIEGETSHYATFLSCSTGQSSYSCDDLQQGVWTYHLCEAFSRSLESVIVNESYVTDISLSKHLSRAVEKYVTEKLSYKQSPRAILNSSDETILVKI